MGSKNEFYRKNEFLWEVKMNFYGKYAKNEFLL